MQRRASVLYARKYPNEKKGAESLTERDVLQMFAKLLTLPNRHRLPGGVLRQIELDVSREIILARTGLSGGIFSTLSSEPKRK